MKRQPLLIVLFVLILVSCKQIENKKDIADFHFMLGQWNSLSTDTYEVWEQNGPNGLLGKTYRFVNDTLRLVNKARIIDNGDIVFEMDFDNPERTNRTYKLIYSPELKDYIFKNELIYPKVIYYKKHMNGNNNLYVLAGESIANKDYFEFLYQRVDSIPK